jgi:hypothetical protein
MKKILLTIILFYSIQTSAQEYTYEETVDYLKTNLKGTMMYPGALDSYKRVEGYKLKDVSFSKDGKIIFNTEQNYGKNDFEIRFNIFDLRSTTDYPEGVRAYNFLVHFQGLNVSSGYGVVFATDAEAKRVARALRYWKSLCKKSSGMFSEEPKDKSITLNKEQTIVYINKILVKSIGEEYKTLGSEHLATNIELLNNETLKYSFKDLKLFNGKWKWKCNKTFKIDFSLISNVRFVYDAEFADYGKKLLFQSDYQFVEIKKSCDEERPTQLYKSKSFAITIKDAHDSSRLIKAFNHLIKLSKEDRQYKKEKDPFGN